MNRPTINDVAREAGVSKATVSAALNGKAGVKGETRRLVEAAAERLNYRPRVAARQLGRRGEPAIGLVVKEIANPFYAEVITGAGAFARERGYVLVVCSSGGDLQEEMRLARALRHQGVEGLVISPATAEDVDYSYLFDFKREHYPFVLLESIHGIQASIVDIDNVAGAKAGALHLVGLGHTRLLHFAGPAYSTHSTERVEGVRRAFSESHLVFTEDVVVPAGADVDDGYRAARAFFEGRLDALPRAEVLPVGITCFNDLVALGVWAALRELGVGVPGEASIVGYDDIGLLEHLPLGLTSVRSPNTEMGRRAAELLVAQVEAGEVPPPRRVNLQTELVIRASTAAPAAALATVGGAAPGLRAGEPTASPA